LIDKLVEYLQVDFRGASRERITLYIKDMINAGNMEHIKTPPTLIFTVVTCILIFIKSRRMTLLGHVTRMEGGRIPRRILEWKPIGRRIRERPSKDGLKTLKKISRRWE
jgi:hypothetical protein